MIIETYDLATLVPKGLYASQVRKVLGAARQVIAGMPEAAPRLELDAALRNVAAPTGVSSVHLFSIVRVALAWPLATPDLFETIQRLGHSDVLARLDRALLRLNDVA